jgi:hypothetical protein
MWQKQLARHWNKTKSYLGDEYMRLGKLAGHLDRAAGIGRRMFALAAPVLDGLGQSDVVQTGMKAIQQYDDAKHTVVDVDSQVRTHGKRIAGAEIF